MEVYIEKLDNMGNGIGYVDSKIVFVPKTLPGDIVDIEIMHDDKKYLKGKVVKIIKSSNIRVNSICQYFNVCGGCGLMNMEYIETLNYKETKIREIFKKNLNIENLKINVVNDKDLNYRNKVSFHIKNNVLGFYDIDNQLISVDSCFLINETLNKTIEYIKSLNIINGEVVLRNNANNEVIICASTNQRLEFINIPQNIKGIIYNDKLIYGNNYFIENINNYNFKIGYKSFFQVNKAVTNKLFNLINENIIDDSNVIDLYCGVGTLGIVASSKAKKVIGIDNLKSNIEDAKYNKRLNKIENIDFVLGDASIFKNYFIKADTIILDPPRKGLNKDTLKNVMSFLPNNIIYISCDPMTLVRDLKEILTKYKLQEYYLLDMFPYTYHVESMCILKLK